MKLVVNLFLKKPVRTIWQVFLINAVNCNGLISAIVKVAEKSKNIINS